jgi:hypothetical protein
VAETELLKEAEKVAGSIAGRLSVITRQIESEGRCAKMAAEEAVWLIRSCEKAMREGMFDDAGEKS